MAYGPPRRCSRRCSPRIAAAPGWSVARAAHELGVPIRAYREIEAGERTPTFETCDRIRKAYGWPQTFVAHG
jgi:hypothetical protein